MTDEPEKVEVDDPFFDEDLEDAQAGAAAAFESGDVEDGLVAYDPADVDDEDDEDELPEGAVIREPEGDS